MAACAYYKSACARQSSLHAPPCGAACVCADNFRRFCTGIRAHNTDFSTQSFTIHTAPHAHACPCLMRCACPCARARAHADKYSGKGSLNTASQRIYDNMIILLYGGCYDSGHRRARVHRGSNAEFIAMLACAWQISVWRLRTTTSSSYLQQRAGSSRRACKRVFVCVCVRTECVIFPMPIMAMIPSSGCGV